MENTYKVCRGDVSCGQTKHISQFYTNKNGYTRCNCKICYSKQVYKCKQQKVKKNKLLNTKMMYTNLEMNLIQKWMNLAKRLKTFLLNEILLNA